MELALLLPFLMFLFCATIDFCRVFYYSQIIENCARNGAYFASDPKAPAYNLYSSIQNAALADATTLSPQPTITSTTGTDSAGNAYVAVTATWSFSLVTNYLGFPSVSLARTVQMRKAP